MSYADHLKDVFQPRCDKERIHERHPVKVIKGNHPYQGSVGKVLRTQIKVVGTVEVLHHLIEFPDKNPHWFQEGDLIECHKEGPGD